MVHHSVDSDNSTYSLSADTDDEEESEFIFHHLSVRITLIFAYTFVFCCCFIGNVLVIVVVIVHRRMRTITNFFLTNLACADLCVGLFCVYQNLSLYLSTDWAFGDFLCKMYHFVHGLSYTTSIVILVLVCVERYIAIMYPILSKRIITTRRLRMAIVLVWVFCAGYCSPRLIMFGTVRIPSHRRGVDTICILKRSLYDSKTYDIANFVVIFAFPLTVISVMYFVIGLKLWRSTLPEVQGLRDCSNMTEMASYSSTSSRQQCTSTARCPMQTTDDDDHKDATSVPRACVRGEEHEDRALVAGGGDSVNGCSNRSQTEQLLKRDLSLKVDVVSNSGRDLYVTSVCRHHVDKDDEKRSKQRLKPPKYRFHRNGDNYHDQQSHRVLKSRRKVIRLLVAVVVCFVVCNLPFHARKMWQIWSPHYDGQSTSSVIFTIITTLIFYMNSGVNPILYAFLSDNFRKSMADVLSCKMWKRTKSRKDAGRSSRGLVAGSTTHSSCSWHQDDVATTSLQDGV